jgi:hypothetical protein
MPSILPASDCPLLALNTVLKVLGCKGSMDDFSCPRLIIVGKIQLPIGETLCGLFTIDNSKWSLFRKDHNLHHVTTLVCNVLIKLALNWISLCN